MGNFAHTGKAFLKKSDGVSTFAAMAGIYLHIPFCKQACHYCDFHFTTSLKYKNELIYAMHRELELQKSYLAEQEIETIYFGGGTPSLLGAGAIQQFIDKIASLFSVTPDAEITLEANPDDLSQNAVQELRQTALNRFSIGIQSFYEEDLRWMNRAHNASEAESSVKRVQDAGFENITMDLIYGYPLLSDEKWKSNIQTAVQFEVPHISAYSMTVEPRTALAAFIRKGKQLEMNEMQSAGQFTTLSSMMEEAGFEHYEISNFAKPGYYSRHNTNYWKNIPYLGIGPSAHSFNGSSRQWNVSNNAKYIESLQRNSIPAEAEELSLNDRFNEYIMTSLRTMWGTSLSKIENDFGQEYRLSTEKALQEFLEKGQIIIEDDTAKLTAAGKLFADKIAAELFQ